MLEKELEKIVLEQKEKDIIPFLKNLTPKDKQSLRPFLKKFSKKVHHAILKKKKERIGTSYWYENTHTDLQHDLVDMAGFVCYNKTDARKSAFFLYLSNDIFTEKILPWYTPSWYSDLINESNPWRLTYDKMMSLYHDGYIEPSDALITRLLPEAIIENKGEGFRDNAYYKPENLLKYPETLETHIWYLFQEESDINNYYSYLHLQNFDGGNDIWKETINSLVDQQKLDRKEVLSATIFTATKGFNKNLSGWFYDLLIQLNPTKEEILELQEEFFSALHSPHSKVVNTVLKFFKTVASHKDFQHKAFIENASILLNAEVKSIITSTLMILDKIVRTNTKLTKEACLSAIEALMHTDNKIQERAAKLISKYGDTKDEELRTELNMYQAYLLHSAKDLLADYLIDDTQEQEEPNDIEPIDLLADDQQIATYESLDDLIFFVSQAIDGNEVYHIDLLISHLPKLHAVIDKDNVSKLTPILKRAFEFSLDINWSNRIGHLDVMAACYINDWANLLLEKYPEELKSYKAAKDKKIAELKSFPYYKNHYEDRLKKVENQSNQLYSYTIYQILFSFSKKLIKQNLTLDLLSTPTHAPCWIDPHVFLQRLKMYEENNLSLDLIDFQIAIERLVTDIQDATIEKSISQLADEELKQVLSYHFGLMSLEQATISTVGLWLASVLVKNDEKDIDYFQDYTKQSLIEEIGNYPWVCKEREYKYNDYDHQKKENVEKVMLKQDLILLNFDPVVSRKLLSRIKSKITGKKQKVSIYHYLQKITEHKYAYIQAQDEIRFLYLAPSNPNVFLNLVIDFNLKESTLWDETTKRNMVNLLKGLYAIWLQSNKKESTMLFLAVGLICSDKVSRELAAEIWLNATTHEQINQQKLGQIMGELAYNPYAPLKRFTDLLTTNMYNISATHNRGLYHLIDNMIGNMSNTPIRNTKKLLEIFLELKLNFPELELQSSTHDKLETWAKTKSMKSLVNKII